MALLFFFVIPVEFHPRDIRCWLWLWLWVAIAMAMTVRSYGYGYGYDKGYVYGSP